MLNHAGPPVTAIPAVAEQATKDLGFTVHMQASENADLLNRFLSQSSAIDCADVSLVYMRYLIGRDVLQAIPLSKFKYWDKTIPLLTKGEYPDGRKAPQQGITPTMILYATRPDGQKVTGGTPTEFVTGIPTVTNGDTLGIRPDLVGREINSWADLLAPEFKGRAALQDNPTVGVIDVAMAVEARGDIKYGNKGNMTKQEIDKTISLDAGHQARWPVPFVLELVRPVGEPDGVGRGGDPVDVVTRGCCRTLAGNSLRIPAAEGRLSRLGLHTWCDEACQRTEARLLLRVHELSPATRARSSRGRAIIPHNRKMRRNT